MRGRLLAAAMLVAWPALVGRGWAADAVIGSWVLRCPGAGHGAGCLLRYSNDMLVQGAGGWSAGLEVLDRGGWFVPVVAVRGLSTEAALAGVLAGVGRVGLRFDGAPRIELGCAVDGGAVVCAPAVDAAGAAAGQLVASRRVVVEVSLAVAASGVLSRSLDLARTADAVAALRAAGPIEESVPVVAGLDWRGFLDRLARDVGFENGLADVVRWVGGTRP